MIGMVFLHRNQSNNHENHGKKADLENYKQVLSVFLQPV